MCKDQPAQIDCRNDNCNFYRKGSCVNISPAITLNTNQTFVCWSFEQISEKREREIMFAEWLSENEWVKRTVTHPNKEGQYYSDKHCEYKSIEELFNTFNIEHDTSRRSKKAT